jgi:hypothetical protein
MMGRKRSRSGKLGSRGSERWHDFSAEPGIFCYGPGGGTLCNQLGSKMLQSMESRAPLGPNCFKAENPTWLEPLLVCNSSNLKDRDSVSNDSAGIR